MNTDSIALKQAHGINAILTAAAATTPSLEINSELLEEISHFLSIATAGEADVGKCLRHLSELMPSADKPERDMRHEAVGVAVGMAALVKEGIELDETAVIAVSKILSGSVGAGLNIEHFLKQLTSVSDGMAASAETLADIAQLPETEPEDGN